jgi:phosphotriesterase-related protein
VCAVLIDSLFGRSKSGQLSWEHHTLHEGVNFMDTNAPDSVPLNVNTVHGPVPVADLGITLTHEHLFADWTKRSTEPDEAKARAAYHAPVDASMRWLLTDFPSLSRDNLLQDEPEVTVEELLNFVQVGGRTVLDCTNPDIGRDPLVLRDIAARAGINVVMGSGWYVDAFHAEESADVAADELCQALISEFADGVGDTGIRPGIIGEIGVSQQFTDSEKIRLRASARAQRQVGVPLFIHLPGWQRRAFEVLDIVLGEEGVAPGAVVLCHMDPSGRDPDYQRKVADRGAWLEFDMIGMTTFYAGEGQSPSPDETARAVAGLIEEGYADRILLSHDFASKGMWTRNGGNGIGYVPKLFLPRLERHGVSPTVTAGLMTKNPSNLFTIAGSYL